ncbi:mechanosensitive ion channel domain-containing protein [uncultured Chitinophaga sp.]|uniref:mechanosensitive ion channel family protein n=1 Tax=uncultured Chitinophaga sp. TaxID=339340 RepID=UPI0025E9F790|nr:mechanosensitive ion channel domain-containing protein [uncultured Chitinophaga sp.]
MVKDPSSSENTSRERKARLLFIGKVMLLGAILYFHQTYPEFFSARLLFLEKVIKGIYLFLGGNIVVSLVHIFVRSWYIRKNDVVNEKRDNFLLGIRRIASVLNAIFGILGLMTVFADDLRNLITSITIVAAAIALLTKDYIQNIINGLIIMFSDQLSLGDQIRINDFQGKILDITLVNVVLQNDDDELLIVPNTVMLTSIVVNQSKQNIKKMNIEFELDLRHFTTPAELEARLKEALQPFTSNITANSFSLKTLEIKKDLARFKVQFLIPRLDKEMERRMKRAINTEILSITKKEVED